MKLCTVMAFCSGVLAFAAAAPGARAQGERIIGWALDHYDMRYLRSAIDRAPEFHVNMIVLCYMIPKHGSQLPEHPQVQRDINELIGRAHGHEIEVFLWTRQFDDPPREIMIDGKVDFDGDAAWKWIDDKYRRLFEIVPGLDGLVLTMRETSHAPHTDRVKSALPPTERLTRLVDAIGAVCDELGKTLYARDFSASPPEAKILLDGINAARPSVRAMTKHVARDWHPFLPPNPALGKYPGRRQIVEFDLCGEYFGQGLVPYVIVEEIKDRWSLAEGKGAVGAVGRLDRFNNHALDTLNEANLYAFTRLLEDSDTSVGSVIRDYAREHYGAGAARPVADALARTYEIVNKTLLVKRMKFLNEHTALPRLGYADSHISSASLAIWLPEYKAVEQELLHPTERTVREVVAEKDEAIALARQSLADVEAAKEDLNPEDYAALRDQFERLLVIARLWRPMSAAFMHYRMLRERPSEEARAALEAELGEMEAIGEQIRARWGDDFRFGADNKARALLLPRLKSFVDDVRKSVAPKG